LQRGIAVLVLTRKVSESIVIDSVIQIQVLKISNGKVKLGVSAPQGVPIQRAELLRRILAGLDETVCLVGGEHEQ
jgi:carbon storage regulator